MHFQHQPFCDVGILAFSLWKHTPALEVHNRLCHGHQCVQGKPGNSKQKFCLKFQFLQGGNLCEAYGSIECACSNNWS